jgi:hypothetical protein
MQLPTLTTGARNLHWYVQKIPQEHPLRSYHPPGMMNMSNGQSDSNS